MKQLLDTLRLVWKLLKIYGLLREVWRLLRDCFDEFFL